MTRTRFQSYAASLAIIALTWAWMCCFVCGLGSTIAQACETGAEDCHPCCPAETQEQAPSCEAGHCGVSMACPLERGHLVASGSVAGHFDLGLTGGVPAAGALLSADSWLALMRARERDAHPERVVGSLAWRSTLLSLGTMLTT